MDPAITIQEIIEEWFVGPPELMPTNGPTAAQAVQAGELHMLNAVAVGHGADAAAAACDDESAPAAAASAAARCDDGPAANSNGKRNWREMQPEPSSKVCCEGAQDAASCSAAASQAFSHPAALHQQSVAPMQEQGLNAMRHGITLHGESTLGPAWGTGTAAAGGPVSSNMAPPALPPLMLSGVTVAAADGVPAQQLPPAHTAPQQQQQQQATAAQQQPMGQLSQQPIEQQSAQQIVAQHSAHEIHSVLAQAGEQQLELQVQLATLLETKRLMQTQVHERLRQLLAYRLTAQQQAQPMVAQRAAQEQLQQLASLVPLFNTQHILGTQVQEAMQQLLTDQQRINELLQAQKHCKRTPE